MPAPRREIHVRHAEGAPEAVIAAIRTERELEKLIAGETAADTRQITAVVSKLHVVIADYLDSGKPLDITLSAAEILSAIETAIQGKPTANRACGPTEPMPAPFSSTASTTNSSSSPATSSRPNSSPTAPNGTSRSAAPPGKPARNASAIKSSPAA